MKNRILFTTDLSDTSRNALNYTLSFAEQLSSEVSILHAYQEQNQLSRWLMLQKRRRQLWKQLTSFATPSEGNIPSFVSLKLRRGQMIQQIVRTCDSSDYRYIVMGKNHSYSAFRRMLGSKTSRVISRANCPVLVLPSSKRFDGIKNILIVGGQYRHLEKAVQEHIVMLSLRFGADLHYIHINENPLSWEFNKEILHKDNYLIQKSIPEDFAVESLSDYLEDHNIDMMVMLTKRRAIFEDLFEYSYRNNSLHLTDVPLLVFNSNFLNQQAPAKQVDIHNWEKPDRIRVLAQ
jgi:nucleotide-binding universal stress UspA family protein